MASPQDHSRLPRTTAVACLVLLAVVWLDGARAEDDTVLAVGAQLYADLLRQGFTHQHIHDAHREFKRFSSLPVLRTIERSNGDIVDCIDRYTQPSLLHPLLQNHVVQEHPTIVPEIRGFPGDQRDTLDNEVWRHQISQESCPEGSIPIPRVSFKEILYSKRRLDAKRQRTLRRVRTMSSLDEIISQDYNNSMAPSSDPIDPNNPTQAGSFQFLSSYLESADATYVAEGNRIVGIYGQLGLWNPNVQVNESSSAFMRLLAGDRELIDFDLEVIEVGWMVNTEIEDSRSRLFGLWTADYFNGTGCYNFLCSGFIQHHPTISFGSQLGPISTDAQNQNYLVLTVFKDPVTHNWWLRFGQNEMIGYWPEALFHYMTHTGDSAQEGADLAQWGGEVYNRQEYLGGSHTTTQMGSGHFPADGAAYAAKISQPLVSTDVPSLYHFLPLNFSELFIEASQPTCYDISATQGNALIYGGPGRSAQCP